MANKTISVFEPELSGETGMKLFVYDSLGVLVNTGGDTLTESGSTGYFTCTVTEAVGVAFYSVTIEDSGGDLLRTGGVLYFADGDLAGTYIVDDPMSYVAALVSRPTQGVV